MKSPAAPNSPTSRKRLRATDPASKWRDEHWMKRALELAARAGACGEVPVGAVIVRSATSSAAVQDNGNISGNVAGEVTDYIAGSDVGVTSLNFGTKVAEAGNLKEACQDALGHAEVRAIQFACQTLGRWRLEDCTLYVTLEPCVMCAGAIIHARVGRVVYGTIDPKAGAVESLYQILDDSRLNHSPIVNSGVLASECSHQLRDFFRGLRQKRAPKRSDPEI